MSNKREKGTQRTEQKKEFKKSASCEFQNMVLTEWDFEGFEFEKDGKKVSEDKIVAIFAAENGEGDILCVEMFGKVMDSFENDAMEGESFTLKCNVSSRKVETKTGDIFYSQKVKVWAYDVETGQKELNLRRRK